MPGLKEKVARQFSHPAGILGRLTGLLMEWENHRLNQLVVQQLAPAGQEQILEVGFGTGRTLAHLSGQTQCGAVAGIDPSGLIVAQAGRRCRRWIRRGRAEVIQGDVSDLPYTDSRFDAVLSVNTIYFWPDPQQAIKEIHRVLKPGGRLLLGYHTAETMEDLQAHGFRLYTDLQIMTLLTAGGFEVDQPTHDPTAPYGATCLKAFRR
ncbi:hypothetical protein GCM10008955_06210 [Deinococcus malanensis]|uniref:Methyltransferase type 11 domain-containing protein n=1 Tax=Deinococcus malanensis TaxID=1706855 RepID=A0ABQ2ENV5_9DEIO|nr:class I SAM-dependent methyltransferase [Deinococcus malanensis]GGK15568.1 hypothetical protein GCM10008955_06210 [Deinococcus malanensis]